MKNEEWREIPGYEGMYQVSDLGRVRSLDRKVRCVNGQVRAYKGQLLRPGRKDSGHVTVALGKGCSRMVHGLVMLAFEGPCPCGLEVLHGNHQPADNARLNLRYGTRSENMKMDYAAGVRKVHDKLTRWGK